MKKTAIATALLGAITLSSPASYAVTQQEAGQMITDAVYWYSGLSRMNKLLVNWWLGYYRQQLIANINSSYIMGQNPPLLTAIAPGIDAGDSYQGLFVKLSQTMPILASSSSTAKSSALSTIKGVVQSRMMGQTSQLPAGDDFVFDDRHLWVKPFGSWGELDTASGFDSDSKGIALGVDGMVNDSLKLGAAFAYATTDVDSNTLQASQTLDVDSYNFIVYGTKDLQDKLQLDFQAAYGVNSNEGSRSLNFLNTTAVSDYDGYSASLGVGLSRDYVLDAKNTFTGSVRGDYVYLEDDSYTETGAGNLSLNVASQSSEEFTLSVEGKLSHWLNDQTEVNVRLGAGYDLINDSALIVSSYAGAPGSSFITPGVDQGPWIAKGGVGFSHFIENGTEITARYDVDYQDEFLNQMVSMDVRWAF